ncbi:MAG TPA: NAD(P)H-dependent oxidoreductase [Kineosporiaceae bacterium]
MASSQEQDPLAPLVDVECPLTVAVVLGSSRPGRKGAAVADWFVAQASSRDMKIDVIDLAALRLRTDLTPTDDSRELAARVDAADAFVVVTPEYNHGYPAALKTALDALRREWAAKPVAFVSYGGLSGGLRAVEQLRAVVAELHMVSLRDTVSFHQVAGCFDATGTPRDRVAAETAAAVLLDRLTWWGSALRAARAGQPYAP